MLTRKRVFPYDYLISMDLLDVEKLPERKAFTSKLSGVECSPDDYAHAQNVWNKFGCRMMRDYLELYLFTDVCLLVDVFETFRATSKEAYDLDSAYFLSAP